MDECCREIDLAHFLRLKRYSVIRIASWKKLCVRNTGVMKTFSICTPLQ